MCKPHLSPKRACSTAALKRTHDCSNLSELDVVRFCRGARLASMGMEEVLPPRMGVERERGGNLSPRKGAMVPPYVVPREPDVDGGPVNPVLDERELGPVPGRVALVRAYKAGEGQTVRGTVNVFQGEELPAGMPPRHALERGRRHGRGGKARERGGAGWAGGETSPH